MKEKASVHFARNDGLGQRAAGLGGGMIAPFNCAIREFYAYVKAIPRFWHTINHSSDFWRLSRQRGNERFFAGLPGPLAD